MRVFGRKQTEPTDEDRVAAVRLGAVTGRFRTEPPSNSGDEPVVLSEQPDMLDSQELPDDDG
jgi:hypothetical protein